MNLSPPELDEIDISLFGPGTGESVVVHIGGGIWFVVDSCLAEDGKTPIALKYLADIEVKSDAIALIVATHWHTDHIRGLSALAEACPKAWVACSAAMRGEEFAALVQADKESGSRDSGISELRRCEDVLAKRKPARDPLLSYLHPLNWNQVLSVPAFRESPLTVEVKTLAPSPGANARARRTFVDLLPGDYEPRRTIGRLKPNQASVVMRVACDDSRILLGGDLEEEGSAGTGWTAVLSLTTAPADRASVFKVPHHGSRNGHHDGQWTELLDPAPVAILTTFAEGDVLRPRRRDLVRLLEMTDQVFMAGRHARGAQPSADPALAALGIKEPLSAEIGHIRLRRRPAETVDWSVECRGAASRQRPKVSSQRKRRGTRRHGRRR